MTDHDASPDPRPEPAPPTRSSSTSLLARLRRPSASHSLGALLAIGFVIGVLVWGGFNTALGWTNREAFCIGCHEMYDNVYVEYQQTLHYSNRTGVRATCADCHVPREWGPMMVRKVQASRELWGKFTGSIDTREKFEAKRLELARREWRRMLANNSLECRNCHALESMDAERQPTRAAQQHARARAEDITCIVCHQGVAHQLPDDMTDEDYFEPPQPVAAAEPAPIIRRMPTTPETVPSAMPPAVAVSTADETSADGRTAAETTDSGAHAPPRAIDWSVVEATEIILFYPGIAHSGWITGEVREGRWRHGGGWAFNNGESCYACHFDETVRMGERIVTGAKLEPTPIAGKSGSIPVQVQAALDDAHLHLRFTWQQPPATDHAAMDQDNAVKLALMLDAGTVVGAERNGCWASCHADSRGMPGGGDERGKYVVDGSLVDGIFYDLMQWRSGDNRGYDGYVAEQRVMEGGSALIEAQGTRDGDTWSVTFTRSLAGGEGNIALEPGRTYNFGFAIHDGHTAGRFHHVSLGYTLGIDAGALISARRQ